jgi:hypothetical protein
MRCPCVERQTSLLPSSTPSRSAIGPKFQGSQQSTCRASLSSSKLPFHNSSHESPLLFHLLISAGLRELKAKQTMFAPFPSSMSETKMSE